GWVSEATPLVSPSCHLLSRGRDRRRAPADLKCARPVPASSLCGLADLDTFVPKFAPGGAWENDTAIVHGRVTAARLGRLSTEPSTRSALAPWHLDCSGSVAIRVRRRLSPVRQARADGATIPIMDVTPMPPGFEEIRREEQARAFRTLLRARY